MKSISNFFTKQIQTVFNDFSLTLSFFTVLVKTEKIASEEEMAKTWFYMVPLGLILGSIAGLPFIFPLKPDLQALLSLVLLVSLTRCFHWDGFADLLDGIGSNTQKENFFNILKDSRIGVFGVTGLILGILSMWILLKNIHSFWAIVGLCVFSRGNLIFTAWTLKKWAKKGMGKIFFSSISFPKILLNLILSALIITIIFDILTYTLAFLGLLIWSFYLLFLARKHRGANGDFLGATIVFSEIIFLVALSLR